MIRELVRIVEAKTGNALPADTVMAIEAEFCRRHRGEVLRVPANSKVVTMQNILDLGTAVPTSVAARQLGVSIRTVQRVRRLLRG